MVKLSLNPVWNQTFRFRGRRADLLASGVLLKVIDWDRFSFNDPLGEVRISLADLEAEARVHREGPRGLGAVNRFPP